LTTQLRNRLPLNCAGADRILVKTLCVSSLIVDGAKSKQWSTELFFASAGELMIETVLTPPILMLLPGEKQGKGKPLKIAA